MSALLAVDVGLRAGLALYNEAGRLQWYRSQNFGSAARLRRAAPSILADLPDLTYLVLEGGGSLAQVWENRALARDIELLRISAEDWRADLLLSREQRNSSRAKQHAADLARQVIDWSGASRPTSLRHDAAEAILIGLWGVLQIGWLPALPPFLKR